MNDKIRHQEILEVDTPVASEKNLDLGYFKVKGVTVRGVEKREQGMLRSKGNDSKEEK